MENTDRIIKCLAYGGKVSVVCANTSCLVEKARKIHDLTPTTTAALGRMLTITAIMGTDMKDKEDSMTVQLKADGPIGTMIVVTDCSPKLKAYVRNPNIDLPLREDGKLDVSGAVGKSGFLNIIKDIGLKNPYIGTVPIVSGEIAEDFTNYFATSMQKPSVIALGVLVDKDGVKSSGGYVITLMPDATEEEVIKIENNLKLVKPISKMLGEKMSLVDIAKVVTGDNDVNIIEESILPVYECNCSREKIEKGLISIGKKELEDIIRQDKKAEIICQFCNKKYNFNEQELKK